MHKTIYRIDQLISEQSAKNPDKIAIKHGLREFTYRNVDKISTQLALFFRDLHIGTGDIVGIALDRSPELIITLLAIIKTGAAYLPIDSNLPLGRINYMLNDTGKILIASKGFQIKHQYTEDIIFIEDALEKCSAYPVKNPKLGVEEDSLAYVLYTSGSTGNPKGVLVRHSGLLNLLFSIRQNPGMNSEDIILATTTISFDIAQLEIFLPLISGALLVIADAQVVKDGRLLLEIARTEKITIMQGTPFMWRIMLEAGWDEPLPISVFCGGEILAKDLAEKLLVRCCGLWNMYGPTETTIYSTIKKISPDDKIITIGKPILNTQVYILDKNGNEVIRGEIGEICIGGAGVGSGYLNNTELTAKKFIDNTFSDLTRQKMYRTGDLGKILENGEIYCLGRIDHQIKIKGYRIEAEEIEVKLKELNNIKEAIVAPFKDILTNVHLVAYVIPECKMDEDETCNHIKLWKEGLKKVLPEYMIPDSYMVTPSVPLMPNGKVDRKALPAPTIRESPLNDFESPHTETEILLLSICLRNIAINKIGITDNFFDLGIDSLVAVKIMIQIEKQFGKRIPLSILINCPTVKQLAAFIDADAPVSLYKSLVPIKSTGNKTPLYIVHGIGLNVLYLYNMISHLDLEQPVYGLQAVGLDGTAKPLDKMELIAEFYIKEIVSHNPTGPYAIAGYSFGGFIAYEIARQLLENGKEVKMLGMFDTNMQYPLHQYPLSKKIRIKLARQFYKVIFRMGTFFTHPVLTTEYLKIYYSQLFRSLFLKKDLAEEKYNSENLPDFMKDIATYLNTAFLNYVVKPNDIKIDLFKAETRMYYVDDSKFMGWKKYALKGVDVHLVPGDHKEMFNPPNDRILSNALQRVLDRD